MTEFGLLKKLALEKAYILTNSNGVYEIKSLMQTKTFKTLDEVYKFLKVRLSVSDSIIFLENLQTTEVTRAAINTLIEAYRIERDRRIADGKDYIEKSNDALSTLTKMKIAIENELSTCKVDSEYYKELENKKNALSFAINSIQNNIVEYKSMLASIVW